MTYASICSIGAYVPNKVMTNSDFESIIETTDEWISSRTGIKTRYIADKDEATSDLAARACEQAIQRAGINPCDVDMLICATITPDYLCMPSTACIVADKLGLKNIAAFDISAACSGFVYGLSIAKAFIESGMKKCVLVIGAETLSRILDYTDRTTCVLFGDGAGAAVVCATQDENRRIVDINISADGEYRDFLITPGGGSRFPCSQYVLDERLNYIKMKGNSTFKVAVKTLSADIQQMLQRTSLSADDIDYFIPHQANLRIIQAVGDSIGLPSEKIVLTVEKYGNTSAASIPMAMNQAFEDGRLKDGSLILLNAFGGGLTWGSALLYFGGKS